MLIFDSSWSSILIYVSIGFLIATLFFFGRNKKGTVKDRLKNGIKYAVLEGFESEIGSPSFMLKLGSDSSLTYSFYLIRNYKIRDDHLKMIPLDKIPKTFKVKRLKTLLPERFPSHVMSEVYVLNPVPETKIGN